MFTPINVDHLFRYHKPTPEQLPKFEAISQAAKQLAQVILDNTPAGADQSAAIRHVRDARMTANAAIALERPTPAGIAEAPRG